MLKCLDTENGIIEYELKSTKSHRIIVKVAKDGKVICSCPQGIALSVAEDFIKSRSKWIVQTSNKLKEQYQSLQSSELNQIFIFGKSYPVVRVESQKIEVLFENSVIYLCGDKQKSQNILKTKWTKKTFQISCPACLWTAKADWGEKCRCCWSEKSAFLVGML